MFAAELSTKLVIFNRRQFFYSALNRLDLATVFISVVFNIVHSFFDDLDKVSIAGQEVVQVGIGYRVYGIGYRVGIGWV